MEYYKIPIDLKANIKLIPTAYYGDWIYNG